ncbi:hypothetical protein LPB85_14015 [Chryseobacterium sp. LC2016-27]|jgi:hypothetical protein|uniref:hypothetical protein n=1 Tax=Chryseobacterium sp. LC2016-27 TaxID=2897326 RepID=UPI001E31B76E|nr:hypothetical protein [Chryseobacterium sp. LC2016-27]MCD0456558.1 hypothetical protein [Chryseobacterium sp. LC2016-27]
MKKFLSLFILLFIITVNAQERVLIKKSEITIPIGKKIILKPEFQKNRIINFELVSEENITEKKDMFDMLKNFKRDETKDNSIELTFSESEMMGNSIFTLLTIQKTGKTMNFKAKIKLKGTTIYQSTSIMPSSSNAASVEQWRDNIDSIFLYDFELMN